MTRRQLTLAAVVVCGLGGIARGAPDSKKCIDCHSSQTPSIVAQWKASAHAKKKVACLDCHQAAANDPDGFDHYSAHIATIVSPLDCSKCHDKEFKQQQASRHADAASFIGFVVH